MKNVIFILLVISFSSCSNDSEKDSQSLPEHRSNTQSHLLGATLFTQESAEYRALCYQAYNLASMRLMQTPPAANDSFVVVLDLDETVLDNSPYTAWQIANDQPFTPETWTQWVDLASAKPVPGVIPFLKLADSLGYQLFFISNRSPEHLQATIKNMRDLDMPQLDSARFMFKTTTSDKTERRDSVLAMGYEIALFIGDNLGDFDGKWDKPATNDERNALADNQQHDFGDKFIVLPNTIYGTWEGALYNYNRDFTDKELDSLRISALEFPELPGFPSEN